ncbi:MAG: hypothetical protein OEU49_00735 [Chromatiales bacterium]|jgi:hypothetical protein|nr:hypothetical protein [Chromatiales bacterium]
MPGRLALPILLAIAPAAAGSDVLRYRVSVPESLDRLSVEVCQGSRVIREFSSHSAEAGQFLVVPDRRVTPGLIEVRHGRIRYKGGAGQCFDYAVDLAAARGADSSRLVREQHQAVLMRSGLWLWRPTSQPAETSIRVAFDLPEGHGVSVPWQPLDGSDGDLAYTVSGSPSDWPDLVAVGRFRTDMIPVAGARLRVAVLGAEPAISEPDMSSWIREAADAITTLYGRFPVPSPQILVVPQGPAGEAVPWAQVLRGGGAAAHFFVDQTRPLDEFREDWTAAHELSHMLLPYVLRDDSWLSEGFASYYQNILRARAGMLTREAAWQKLYDGFQRGRDGTRGASLVEASRDMRKRGSYMRVYWSGAAIALMADVELRRRSRGQQSLDTALGALAECCLPSDRAWTGSEVFGLLDDLTSETVFMELYEEHAESSHFPDLGPTNTRLGIDYRSGQVRLSDAPAAYRLRGAIMSPADGRPIDARSALERQEIGDLD